MGVTVVLVIVIQADVAVVVTGPAGKAVIIRVIHRQSDRESSENPMDITIYPLGFPLVKMFGKMF